MPTPTLRVSLVREAPSPDPGGHQVITGPADVRPFVENIAEADREHFVVFHLNARHHVIGRETVSIGSLSASIVHPREVFKAAILANSACLLLAHNHPSGDTAPSRDDLELTKRLVQAGEILGVEVLDHVIVGPNGKIESLKEKGLI